MAKVQKIGNVKFRELTNEEALQKYGSSFVFVGARPASLSKRRKSCAPDAFRTRETGFSVGLARC